MRLLLTRPEDDSLALAGILRAAGHDCLISPLLEVHYLQAQSIPLAGIQALLITSANGARAAARNALPLDMPVYAVGDASARTARELGFAKVESAGGDVQDLARLVTAQLAPADGGLLHIVSGHVAGDLAALLGDAGFEYQRIKLYDTELAAGFSPEAETALKSGQLDAVLLYSPRTAKHFARLFAALEIPPRRPYLQMVCLSQAVAGELASLSGVKTRIASGPTQAALLEMLHEPAPSSDADCSPTAKRRKQPS